MKRLLPLIFAGFCFSTYAGADEPDVAIYDYRPASGPSLVFKSGTNYFKLYCDDSNRLEQMVIGLGFNPRKKFTAVTTSHAEYNTITTNLTADGLFCKGFASFTGALVGNGNTPATPPPADGALSFDNSYRLVKFKDLFYVHNPIAKQFFEIGCNGLLDNVEYNLLDKKPYGTTQRIFDQATLKSKLQCASGTLILNPQAPKFNQNTVTQAAIAGSAISYKFQVTDPESDPIQVFLKSKNCPWLKLDPEGLEISGTSYPSTVPYSCNVTVGAFGGGEFSDQDLTLTVNIEPVKITSMTAGFRRNCIKTNNGKVACWGPADSVAGANVKEMALLVNADLIAANKTFNPRYAGIYFTKGNELLILKNGATDATRVALLPLPIKALQAGAEPACVQTTDNLVRCYGERVANYDLPSDTAPDTYTSFMYGAGIFCGEHDSTGTVQCRFPALSMPLGAAGQSYGAGGSQVCGVMNSGSLSCLTRDANDAVGVNKPTTGFYKKVSNGNDFACSLSRENTVQCWGSSDTYGQIFTKPEFFGDLQIQDIMSGFDHSCVLGTNAQTTICWGSRFFNDLTDGVSGVPRKININDMLPELAGWEVVQ
ncbi:MAG TPA: hypothetical protein VE954_22880 [Oligoflexus sp.]|uniref:hypothetical protein n=1 Tax=Oligoflexus sp. TaxID=1971216 RepID=UPI002D4776D1|nr:hypothetical protein [Oligoflexus sp.]HYX35956.1 hypothetical protein [Oligoflexus sp.]